ncbi:hypothetical protein MP213Fo_28710 [Pseudochrobactrum sp. MP213Fo]
MMFGKVDGEVEQPGALPIYSQLKHPAVARPAIMSCRNKP